MREVPAEVGLCMSLNPCSASPKFWLRKQAAQRSRASQPPARILDIHYQLYRVSLLVICHTLKPPLKMPLLETSIALHPRNMEQNSDEIIAKFEELSVLESEFDDVELEIRM